MIKNKPIFGITMGDPAGIGPEIAVKTAINLDLQEKCNMVIIGNSKVIQREINKYTSSTNINVVNDIDECRFINDTINVFEIDVEGLDNIEYGVISPLAGKAAFLSVKKSIELALDRKIDACITGPIHKKSINEAGFDFAGHTEIFAHYTNTKSYGMLLLSDRLKVIHVTTHVSLREACSIITKEKVLDKILLLNKGLKALGIQNPRIGVAGLNPHAGDEGLFGDEEIKFISPAIELAIQQNINVEGPVPPDTLFPKAISGSYDGCVVMYHDQGHIPFKLLGFTWNQASGKMESVSGVNVTLGLPILRSSVDHGTAFDIAGKGIASSTAMVEAIEYALKITSNKEVEI